MRARVGALVVAAVVLAACEVDAGVTIGDPDCDPDVVGEEFGSVLTIHSIEDGELGEPCFGEAIEVVADAWESLATVTPPGELELVTVFAGFDGGDDTLAFAGPVTPDHDEFMIAIDVVSAEDDQRELLLTLLHEFAHVFTQTTDELDVEGDPDDCEVLWNGAGCFWDDSYVALWVDEFWPDSYVADLPDDGSADEEGGDDRCELDATFLGPYAASAPEEDLAESFSAFVFDLEVPPGVSAKIDWFAQFPELAEFRDRQRAAGFGEVANTFARCG